MKLFVYIFLATALVVGVVACRAKPLPIKDMAIAETRTVVEEAPPPPPPVEAEPLPIDDPVEELDDKTLPIPTDAVRLVVSFYSPGDGINGDAVKAAFNLKGRFEEENKVKIVYYTVPWGREGEVDFCFDLKLLNNTKLADEFVAKVKAEIGTMAKVNIYENKVCRQRR